MQKKRFKWIGTSWKRVNWIAAQNFQNLRSLNHPPSFSWWLRDLNRLGSNHIGSVFVVTLVWSSAILAEKSSQKERASQWVIRTVEPLGSLVCSVRTRAWVLINCKNLCIGERKERSFQLNNQLIQTNYLIRKWALYFSSSEKVCKLAISILKIGIAEI